MAGIPVGLQMYTVRDKTAEDYVGTYRQVAEMGYQGVEIAGTGGLSADQMKALLDDCGFQRCGSHVGLQEIEQDPQAVIDYNLAIGNPWVVVPYLSEDLRGDAAAWRAMGARLSAIGEKFAAAGLTLCYHNHAFEFDVEENGQYGLDILYSAARPEALQAEIDTYWVQYGKQDPVTYIKRYAGRAPLLHIKDMTPGDHPTFTEVGTGILDFNAIVAAGEECGAKAFIIEQDRCAGDSLESAQTSFGNFMKLLASRG